MSQPPSGTGSRSTGWRVLVLTLVLVLWPVLLRLLLLRETASSISSNDLWGFAWDVVGGLVATVLALVMGRVVWLGGETVVFVWVLLGHASYEFVRALGQPLDWKQAGYLLDPVFLRGSALSPSHPWILLAAVGVGLAVVRLAPARRVGLRALVGLLGVALLLGAGLSRRDSAVETASWRQEGPLRPLFAWRVGDGRIEISRPPADRVADALRWDGSGRLRSGVPPADRRAPNVLLVILEGVSGGFLPRIAAAHGLSAPVPMETLDRIIGDGWVADRFLTQQRQTHRGEYALLCGDLPRLSSGAARFGEPDRPWPHPCLPEILAGRGYQTAYLQAAPLPFMMKDQGMAKAGFERVLGVDWFDERSFRTHWGVDDGAFFRESLRLVDELERGDGPWFLTLLNVGTHHPFVLPDGVGAGREWGGAEPRIRALRYLDEVVGELWRGLVRRGVPRDTLIVFTSDESMGLEVGSDTTRALSQNLGFLSLRFPGETPTTVSEPYGQSDLAVSILDYLAVDPMPKGLLGRSVLREYDEPRPVYFANLYLRQTYGLFPNGLRVTCHESGSCRNERIPPFQLLEEGEGEDLREAEAGWVLAVRERSDRVTSGSGRRGIALVGGDRIGVQAPYQYLFGGQDFEVPDGVELDVTLDLELPDDSSLRVHLRHDLRADGGVVFAHSLPVLAPGDRVRLRYRVLSPGWRAVQLGATLNRLMGGRGELRVHSARVELAPGVGAADEPGVVRIVEETLERDRPLDDRILGLPAIGREDRHGCLVPRGRGWVAKGCRSGLLVSGPRWYVPSGGSVQATWSVRGKGGSLTSLLGSAERGIGIGTSQPLRLDGGGWQDLVLRVPVEVSLNEVQLGLVWEATDAGAHFEVRDLEVRTSDP